jgi:hypothetical protein
MPNTLIPIQTVTVGSGGSSSVEFTNIPQNYTDLVLKVSARSNTAYGSGGYYYQMTINGATTNQSTRYVNGNGTNATSGNFARLFGYMVASDQTSSTFASDDWYFPNYAGSTNKSISCDMTGENNATLSNMNILAGLWSQTAAISSISLIPNAGLFAQHSTATLYGVSNGVKATGGTLTVAGGYAYHTFTSTGSFLPSQKITGAEVLAVAGGGGAGSRTHRGSGGGGAGGVLYANSVTLNAGNSYTALVGAGGTGGSAGSSNGAKGNDSILSNLSAIGGGFGPGISANGGNGGSGGGGFITGTGGSPTSGQGFAGGNGGPDGVNVTYVNGGGGGAGGVGGAGTITGLGGAGGVGTATYSTWHSITGTGVLSNNLYYIGGGGGAGSGNYDGLTGSATSGGIGGGGAGNPSTSSGSPGTSGTANTGGGGGGGNAGAGGTGGSGLIIVRYPLS